MYLRFSLPLVVMLLIWPLSSVQANGISKFYGKYSGETTDNSSGKEVKRNLGVEIKKTGKGFNVSWQTTSIKSDGRVKTKEYSIDFIPSERENIYSSAMKTNLFGGKQALDPLKGDPYVWARINGDNLIIHALVINDNGGFELLTYDRQLVEDGMSLVFSRIDEVHEVKHIEAKLIRQ